MQHHRHRISVAILMLPLLLSGSDSSAESNQNHSHHEEPTSFERPSHDAQEHEDGDLHERHGEEAVTSMAETHAHRGPHFRWTTLRAANPADRQRAAEITAALRNTLEPYRDYRKAIEDGYEPFLPNVKQPLYHFTSKWRGLKSAFRFNPEQPTSLLYKKTEDGYELEGAMYTAPKRADETTLNKRIPLSVAQWHAHVNICLPPKRDIKTADWTTFGPKGSILTESDCDAVHGRWVPQLFGWMVHIYPFRDSIEQIWTH